MNNTKQIPNHSDYAVTKDGRVWSCRFKRWLNPQKNSRGYLVVHLPQQHNYKIHHIVLETYVGLRSQGMECRHLNGNKTDNRLDNLCWGTSSENAQDAIRHGTHTCLKFSKTFHPSLKLNTIEREMIFYAHYYNTCTIQELADAYYVSRKTIEKIVREFKVAKMAV